MTAEPIAKVIADIKTGKVQAPAGRELEYFTSRLVPAAEGAIAVDATAIYQALAKTKKPVYLYEDHPCIAPPWTSAFICFVNQHGNVVAMQVLARKKNSGTPEWEPTPHGTKHHVVEWDRVRWIVETFIWLGGKSGKGESVQTTGPVHAWQYAIYQDGAPADIRWIQLQPDYPMTHWDMAALVLLGALNFCNCVNVKLVEPVRSRPERRRLEKIGVQVHTINVFSTSNFSREKNPAANKGVPLTNVRGHFAKYGSEYNRGLLFGRIAGRFFIPQHARGSADLGISQANYILRAK
jgi:hypothetical protein